LSHIKLLVYFYQVYKCQVAKWIWQHCDGISINSIVCNELSCLIESNNVQKLLHLINVIISSFSISPNKVANFLDWNKCEDIVFLVPLSVPLSLASPQDPNKNSIVDSSTFSTFWNQVEKFQPYTLKRV
jgi:hypothetical protein